MRIALRAALAGEMLERGNDPGLSQPLPESQGMLRRQPGVRAEAAPQLADGRIVRIAVHVRHGRKVHGNAQPGQFRAQPRGQSSGGRRAPTPHAPGRRQVHKTLLRLEPPDAASFLIHGNEHGTGGGGAQRGRQTAELLGGTDVALSAAGQVAVEQQDMSHLARAHRRQKGIVRRKFRAAKTQHQHGAEHDIKRREGRGRGRSRLAGIRRAGYRPQAAERPQQTREEPPPRAAGC